MYKEGMRLLSGILQPERRNPSFFRTIPGVSDSRLSQSGFF